ncbi:pantoate--beta-alanine ligase [Demetria terragena]|uniref:pantoate--beta-alanine ligase n=1 Tax=Demetria terragena TaxID=63959 RepID=UPI0003714BFC|nr:pantoate--beta-alanine ligase [Demetria terragena]
MTTVRTVADLRAALAPERAAGRRIGLVPTMGALHDGHAALIRAAAAECDVVVVSVFVNPRQFEDAGDLAAYPRDEVRDAELARNAGADLMFIPNLDEVYPTGFATSVRVTGVSETLEGAARGPVHFDGVATVVTKLFTMTGPDAAYFGRKDAQQVVVVRRLVTDLNLPVEIRAIDTVREPDGLALSSRNVRLTANDRSRALVLRRALQAVRTAYESNARDPEEAREAGMIPLREQGIEPEYLALVDPDTLQPVASMAERPVLVAVAAKVGDVRLIDNELLS